MPNQALEQTRDNVLRYGEVIGCELLNFFVIMEMPLSFYLTVVLLPTLAIFILVVGIGMVGWMRLREDDLQKASRTKERADKNSRIASYGAQPGDVIVDNVSLHDIQGCWQMVSLGRNGNFAPPEVLERRAVRFRINGAAFSIEPTNGSGTLNVDPSFSPVHLDQCDEDGDTHLCIVRLRNQELEICQGEVGAARPTDFDPNRNDNASLTRFKRVT